MEILIAIAHFLGALFVSVYAGFVWFSYYNEKSELAAEKIALDVYSSSSARESSLDEMKKEVLLIFCEKYSSEKFENRLADFFGYLYMPIVFISYIAEVGIFLVVGYFTIFNNLDTAAYFWLVVPFLIVIYFFNYIFSGLCEHLTGRFPGQPRNMRKNMEKELAKYNFSIN